ARAAPELDDILPGNVLGQEEELAIRDVPDAPGDVRRRPVLPTRLDVFLRVAIPALAIRANVLGQLLDVRHDGDGRPARHSAGTPPDPRAMIRGHPLCIDFM